MNIMMLTGAGISTGAGLSTYRGEDGRYTAIEQQAGMPVQELLTPQTLANNPELVWKYWKEFSLALQKAQPAPAHEAIVALAGLGSVFLEVTQNVDGLSRKAGLAREQVIELHGSYHRHYCTGCGHPANLWIHEAMAIPPRCYVCRPSEGAVLRPDVVMFNECISSRHYCQALDFAQRCDLLIICGTSLQFAYLVDLISMAVASDAVVVFIDPQACPHKQIFQLADAALDVPGHLKIVRQTADLALPLLAKRLRDAQAGLKFELDREQVGLLIDELCSEYDPGVSG